MIGKLRDVEFFKGMHTPVTVPRGEWVTIVDKEVDPIYGIRYKILGFPDWFEASCFAYVECNNRMKDVTANVSKEPNGTA